MVPAKRRSNYRMAFDALPRPHVPTPPTEALRCNCDMVVNVKSGVRMYKHMVGKSPARRLHFPNRGCCVSAAGLDEEVIKGGKSMDKKV